MKVSTNATRINQFHHTATAGSVTRIKATLKGLVNECKWVDAISVVVAGIVAIGESNEGSVSCTDKECTTKMRIGTRLKVLSR